MGPSDNHDDDDNRGKHRAYRFTIGAEQKCAIEQKKHNDDHFAVATIATQHNHICGQSHTRSHVPVRTLDWLPSLSVTYGFLQKPADHTWGI
jgi:hypothetical protein